MQHIQYIFYIILVNFKFPYTTLSQFESHLLSPDKDTSNFQLISRFFLEKGIEVTDGTSFEPICILPLKMVFLFSFFFFYCKKMDFW